MSMASSSLSPPSFLGALLHRSLFLGQNHIKLPTQRLSSTSCPKINSIKTTITAKFNLLEISGGRGLCNGEARLQEELKKEPQVSPLTKERIEEELDNSEPSATLNIQEEITEDGFEKELLGLTGGFPGGEKGLRKFLEKNPPPPKTKGDNSEDMKMVLSSKPKPPDLPLLLPGMIALVNNPNNPYYMYCGIVQRITDGKAGVLFEGGNWDRLITFRLEELERREKGPPMTNPKSVVLEPMIEMLEKQNSETTV